MHFIVRQRRSLRPGQNQESYQESKQDLVQALKEYVGIVNPRPINVTDLTCYSFFVFDTGSLSYSKHDFDPRPDEYEEDSDEWTEERDNMWDEWARILDANQYVSLADELIDYDNRPVKGFFGDSSVRIIHDVEEFYDLIGHRGKFRRFTS